MTTTPRAAYLYARISDAKNGDTTGVDDQEKRLRQHADRLGWGVGTVIVENDTSAFQRRKVYVPGYDRPQLRVVRPGWRTIINGLASGAADGLLALDLDRACRDPRDLEDLIDVVEAATPRLPVESLTGSLRLANDADVTQARVMVAIANKASRDTARRVAASKLRQAEAGKWQGGQRPFGFEPDGVTVRPAEAVEIVRAAEQILAGVSLNAVVRGLRARGVTTVSGRPWARSTLNDMIVRPRIAGLMSYRGEVLEQVAAPWPAILDRARWEAVRAILADPARVTNGGVNEVRWLGSGLFACWHPDCRDRDPNPKVRASINGVGRRTYRCRRTAHLAREIAGTDEWVLTVVAARLERRDAAGLLAPRAPVDTAALSIEANGIRARIAEAGDLWEAGTITGAELTTRRRRLNADLDSVTATLNAAAGTDPLAGLAGNPDAGKVLGRLDIGRQRAVVDRVCVVRLLPAVRGGGFRRESVQLVPRGPA
ncbi:MAG: recombinase family protein [Micromonosporaceae bacterium]|nr:recombinase family protein [Micromonosporaceae bacterium]